jgi:hypothetical protein
MGDLAMGFNFFISKASAPTRMLVPLSSTSNWIYIATSIARFRFPQSPCISIFCSKSAVKESMFFFLFSELQNIHFSDKCLSLSLRSKHTEDG